ncbi:TyrR family helix-turn-helix protein [Nicoletella semolina]|uniref:HTH-type transcriptional regulatory protein TyrR n=1 Tax=Nicoletella semolina TaxID=271160 RepID=A0A4R2N515_9PAST|nr:sigma 54-interacting transcriptional regulator [Nicoletella semolina]MDH2924111.1 transcriptional regulator [Nicoletella semolina]TCP15885.1 TyrR family helix-turn-helix protein [Nicoletella semolina]
MRLAIECIDSIKSAQQILGLLIIEKVNFESFEIRKCVEKEMTYLHTETLCKAQQKRLIGLITQLSGVVAVNLIEELSPFMSNQRSEFDYLVAQDLKMKAVVEQAKKFARLNAPLLIQGETGTGKDIFAKACHQFSGRRSQKFIAVNCAGLPKDEAESEMFGYHSQSEGRKSVGFFEYANGGTVLLDSVAELSLEMQAKLLRFLNDGSFRRVGEDREIQVDVRVICTSQKPLERWVAEGKMREDLYHRLNVLVLNLPPLRERRKDLPLLVEDFIQQISQQLAITPPPYSTQFVQAILGYPWSGNLRELYNSLYRACSMANGQLRIEDLNLPKERIFETHFVDEIDVDSFEQISLEECLNQFEARLLSKFYAKYPSTRKLAQRLGLSHTAVANKLRAYGIGKHK